MKWTRKQNLRLIEFSAKETPYQVTCEIREYGTWIHVEILGTFTYSNEVAFHIDREFPIRDTLVVMLSDILGDLIQTNIDNLDVEGQLKGFSQITSPIDMSKKVYRHYGCEISLHDNLEKQLDYLYDAILCMESLVKYVYVEPVKPRTTKQEKDFLYTAINGLDENSKPIPPKPIFPVYIK